MIDSFNELVNNGLKPIILRPGLKAPIQKGWNQNWTLSKNLWLINQMENPNLGILLGEIIDVEGDTEAANQKLLKLIGSYEHPCYKSKKSIHHLFLSPDPKLRILKYRGIEFRGHGHQSVMPPSRMVDGVQYEWIHKMFPIPEMPQPLYSFFKNLYKSPQKETIKPGHMLIRCALCHNKKYIHRKRFILELASFKELHLPWSCLDCRSIDLRERCRDIRKYLQRKGTLCLN